METTTRIWTIIIPALVVLTACSGTQLNTFDSDFERLYSAKAESIQNNDDASALAADFDLLELADDAEKAGDDTSKKDWKTAVAFYRIAALAVWQAGEDGEDQILPTTNKGQKLCEGKTAESPRDCILMMIIGPLAIHDDLARDLAPIQVKGEIHANDSSKKLSAKDLEMLVNVFDGVKIQFDKVSEIKMVAATSPAPSRLDRYIENQQFLLFCTAKVARATMLHAPEEGGRRKAQETQREFFEMKNQVEESSDHSECPSK